MFLFLMCVHFLKISSKEWNYRVKGPEIVTKTKILPVASLSDLHSRLLFGLSSVLQQDGTQEEIKYVDQTKKSKTTSCNREMTSFEINLKEKK